MTLTRINSNGITNGAVTNADLAFDGGPLGSRNRIINGDMRIDQRNAGAAVTVNAAVSLYPVDRIIAYGSNSAGVFTAQRTTTAPSGFTNAIICTVTTASTPSATHEYGLTHNVEGFNIADLSWGTANAKTVTLSFWVRSSITGTHSGCFTNDAYNRSYVFTFAVSQANTYEYKTVTIPGDTTGTWTTDNSAGIRLRFNLGAGSSKTTTAGSWVGGYYQQATGAVTPIATNGATFYITGVQLEAGTVATPFERRHIGLEVLLCQRYCCQFGRSQIFTTVAYGLATSTTVAQAPIILPVEMRASPTSITSSGSWQVSDGLNGFAITSLTVPAGQSSTTLLTIQGVAGGGGLVAHRPIRIESANNTTAYILVSAEL